MSGPLAYLNGRWIPASAAALPVGDAGFVQGAAVAEQLRTFGGKLFRLDAHLARLARSLEIIGVDPGIGRRELASVAEELVAQNRAFQEPDDDLGLSIVVTPGAYPTFAEPGPTRPTVCLHTYPLPFHLWAGKYRTGQALATTSVEQVSPRCWPPELKCRSRMHYYLADREAARRDPAARALLLDARGRITEASTANLILVCRGEGLVSPRLDTILHGISLAVAVELAGRLGLGFHERDLTPADAASADEVLLTSTAPCVLPVTRFDGRPIGDGRPGEVFTSLLKAWNELAGLDIAAQAARYACRGTGNATHVDSENA